MGGLRALGSSGCGPGAPEETVRLLWAGEMGLERERDS
jgi:hypothetical protein